MKKTAIITGANKGIGLAMALQLAEKGIDVIITSRNLENGQKALAHFAEKNLTAQLYTLDVADENSIEQFVQQIKSTYPKIDMLINNAGVHLDGTWVGNTLNELSPSILYQTFNTNFFGAVQLTQKLLPLLMQSDGARVVNISSIMGSMQLHSQTGSDIWDVKPFAYDASKAAFNQFTIHLAHLFHKTAHSAVAVHPGWVKTDLGGEMAPLQTHEGALTGVMMALAADTRFNGKFMHMNQEIPW